MQIYHKYSDRVSYTPWPLIFLIFYFGYYATSYAQDSSSSFNEFSFNNITVNEGLSQNSVVSIDQDTTGFLWFATQDGLNRYDGREFNIIKEQFEDVTRPTYSRLGKVFTDKTNNLWAITYPGILKYYDRTKNEFKKVNSVNNASVIYEDSYNNLYIATFENGIYKIAHDTKDTVQVLDKAYRNLNVYDLIEHENDIWIAASGGIYKLNPKKHSLDVVQELPDTNFSSFTQIADKLYIGSYGKGLFVYSTSTNSVEQFRGFNNKRFHTNFVIQDLLTDNYDRLWVATYGQGLYIIDFNNKIISHFMADKNNPYAIHYNDILSLFQDNTGTIWLGTDGGGLSYYDEYLSKFNTLTNKQLPEYTHVDVARSIVAENGNIWIGTSGKGLTKINLASKESSTINADNSNLLGDRIMSLYHGNNFLWIGHQDHGLQKMSINGNIFSIAETKDFTIWKILKAKNNRIWLCTRNHGLVLYDVKKGIEAQFNRANSLLTTDNVRTITYGRDSIIWIGTEHNGLFYLDTTSNKITQIKTIPDKIKSLYYQNDTLWIGTNGNGLALYNTINDSIQRFTTKNGLANNVIYGILPDNQYNLWLSSNKGISKFSLKNGQPLVENYENYDGLQSYEFNTGAYFKGADGTLYFGGLEGINWFNPDQLKTNPYKPKTVITNVKVFNATRSLSEKIPLKHTQNTITFTFSSLQFSQPKLNQYKYRLVGNDNDWTSAGNNNQIRYTNLPPGKYTFEVISSNYDGVWGNYPATYHFEIEQPWHFTNMAPAVFTSFTLQGCFIAIGIFMFLLYFKLRKPDYILYGSYILLFAAYFFLRIDLELQTGLFVKDSNTIYNFLTPLIFLVSGIFIMFVNSFAEIKNYHPRFSKELNWFAFTTYILAAVSFLYLMATKNISLVRDHLNLILLPMHLYGIYAVIRAYIIVKSPLRYYILLGNIFLIGLTMIGVYYGSRNAFTGGAEANNLLGFYSFNISQVAVFLEMIVFSLGLGHKFYFVEIEKDKIQKTDELKTKLYTDISHEIRTPLTLISGPIEHQLERENLSSDDKKELTLIKDNAQRLLGLVNQMLDLSMIDSGHLKLKVTKGDLRGILVQLVEAYSYLAREKNIDINYELKKMDRVWFDKDVIEKVVSNLLSNAIKYAPKNSEVWVNAKKAQGDLIFSIINHTDGMTIEDLGKLFKRFYRNNKDTEGVGVGLALVRELVSLSNGSIIANSIGEDKIQFTLTLPVTQPEIETNTVEVDKLQKSDPIENAPITQNSGKKATLLLIEDDKDVLKYISSIFKSNYKVIKAQNGKVGLEMALQHCPDLIISDLMMPLKNGIELCHDIKNNEFTSHIAIILLTAKANEESELKGFRTGADAYITKPFNPNILKVRVAKLLENRTRLQKHYSRTFKIDPGLVPTKTEAAFLKRLQNVLDNHITSTEFTSEKFSKLMLMSRSQLHKKLNAISGMSTSEFVRVQRINLAKKLLKESDATISEIGYQVGFNTPSYFTKCFKEIVGCTPNEYISKQS
ncbi:hybrid sensor histidine kinase/response regulator transcription factor [Maribacter thermophilus]|uniref:hybrid sensor histidine kinase/response regulator transcription factor n=1 Tax=Maribacter thermophilus TaxID=1197874 RepID=UPI00069A609F|nr:two-component regulator propeller domain-containing protein [Maribacter thermophilus]